MGSRQRLLAVFGNGQHGRLGLASVASQLYPTICTPLQQVNVVSVACGGGHTVVLSDDGSVHTFGLNDSGQLGHSENESFVPVPLEVPLPDPIKYIAAGNSHTLCVAESGEVWAFGSHQCGQLGVGPGAAKHATPRLLRALQGVGIVQVAAGWQHSLGLASNGEVYAWGEAVFGALGTGPVAPQVHTSPTLVKPLAPLNVKSVAAGHYHSGCVDSEGRAYLWGHGGYWQLGSGDGRHCFLPRRLPGLPLVRSLALGGYHSMAATQHDALFVWGSDEHGSTGQGWKFPVLPLKQPAQVQMPQVAQASAGWKHSAAVTTDGRLYTWGWGGSPGRGGLMDPEYDLGAGQLGTGTDVDQYTPEVVVKLVKGPRQGGGRRGPPTPGELVRHWVAKQVACGANHTAVVVECYD